MKFIHLLAALAAVVGTAVVAQPRSADPRYVLNVPVTISKLGPGHRAEVACSIDYFRPGDKFPEGSSNQRVPVPLDRSGNFSGTITVKLPTPSGKVAPNHYRCVLDFDGGSLPPHAATNRPTWISEGSF